MLASLSQQRISLVGARHSCSGIEFWIEDVYVIHGFKDGGKGGAGGNGVPSTGKSSNSSSSSSGAGGFCWSLRVLPDESSLLMTLLVLGAPSVEADIVASNE